MAGESDTDVLRLTAKIVSAHVGKNQVAVDALPELIQSVHRSLASAGTAKPAPAPAPPMPAVPIRKSVFPDHIVCLEDGKKLKMLKRHLQTSYGMTPQQYRQKWGLPADYPMVAPNYASHRSSLAKQAGLGRKQGRPAPEQTNLTEAIEEPDLPVQPPVTQGRARRARGSKG
jgi:predicted transcriptional regulator